MLNVKTRMNRLNIVVVGSEPETSESKRCYNPLKTDVEQGIEILTSNGYELRLILLGYDDLLRKVSTHPEITAELESYPEEVKVSRLRLDEWLEKREEYTSGEGKSLLPSLTPDGDEVEEEVKFEKEDVIYVVRGRESNSPYDVMDIVEEWSPEYSYVPITEHLKLTKLVEDFLQGKLKHHDFYSGEGSDSSSIALATLAYSTAEVLEYYTRAGFLRKEVNVDQYSTFPSWILNVECSPLKGFIGYYGLRPLVEDITPSMAIVESEDYRALLTKTMASVLSNFVISSGIITEEEANSSDWTDPAFYKLIKEKI